MGIQIYGGKKCFDTQKAERYFKERNIKFQKIDLHQFGMGKRELESVKNAIGINELINEKSKLYGTLNIAYIGSEHNKIELLLKHPQLFKTPIVRLGNKATVGFASDVWKEWDA